MKIRLTLIETSALLPKYRIIFHNYDQGVLYMCRFINLITEDYL